MSRVSGTSVPPLLVEHAVRSNEKACGFEAMPTVVLKHLVDFMDVGSIGGVRRAVPDFRDIVDNLLDIEIEHINASQARLYRNARIPIDKNPQPLLWRLNDKTVYATSLQKLRERAKDSTTPTEILGRWENGELKGLASCVDIRIKQNVSANQNTSTTTLGYWENNTLRGLAAEETCLIKSPVASHSKTAPSVLGRIINGKLKGLAADPCHSNRAIVATNPNTPKPVLAILASDPHEEVRAAVASNPNTDKEVLLKLSNDHSPIIRRAVAENENTSPAAFYILENDKDFGVLLALCKNIATPPEILKRLSSLFADSRLKLAVAANPSTPPSHLYEMAKFGLDHEIKMAALNNPSCPDINDEKEIVPKAFTAVKNNIKTIPKTLQMTYHHLPTIRRSRAFIREAFVAHSAHIERRRQFGHPAYRYRGLEL